MRPADSTAFDCCAGQGDQSVAAALERLLARARPLPVERVPLRRALGRVLATPVVSPIDIPGHDNSAMDGYALRADDLAHCPDGLPVVGSAFAGQPFPTPLPAASAVRIMTGAVVPDGADTIVMQEQCRVTGDRVAVDAAPRRGDNLRRAGEDIARGSSVCAPGTRVGPAQLGVLGSLGLAELEVYRRPRVAILSTGDELREAGEPLAGGAIYDSNRQTLYGMLTRGGAEVIDLGIIRDRPELIEAAFLEAAAAADCVITSGGVSVGEADYVKPALEHVGDVDFWKIAMKPGRPLAFGRIGDALFFGLPGNPVSVMVGYYQFVRPVLLRCQGVAQVAPPELELPCRSRLKKRPGRTEFQRGVMERDANGRLGVRTTGAQGSGILRSMHEADCFIVLPEASGGVEPGDLVRVQPFHGLID